MHDQERHTSFLEALKGFYAEVALKDSLGRIRAKAWDLFEQRGLPSRKEEVYRYVRLRPLTQGTYARASSSEVTSAEIAPHVLPESKQTVIVFVNGAYAPALSNISGLQNRATLLELTEAMHEYQAFLNNQWTSALKEETDPFALLNMALHLKGLFFYVPPGCLIDSPIQFLHFLTGEGQWACPRMHIVAGKNSRFSIVASTVEQKGGSNAVNQVVDLLLEDNAKVHYTQVCSRLESTSWQMDAFRAKLKRDSELQVASVTTGALTVRQDYRVTLTQEGALAQLNGLWALDEKREAHTNVLIEHQAPHCRSHQLFKGVLTDISRSSFEGKILVRQAAQKTDAYQLNRNLLLSDLANADSKPNLEVFADDVKASHGATVGQLDAEQLFYLQARGLSAVEAKNVLIQGFTQEVIDLITPPSLREELLQQMQVFLS